MLKILMDDLKPVSDLLVVIGVADFKESMGRDLDCQLGHVAVEFATCVLFPRVR